MGVRLSKAIRELNIGLQTAVDYLSKKPSLGEVTNDVNFKLSDKQYEALVAQFKQDADVHSAAEKIFSQKKEKRAAAATTTAAEPSAKGRGEDLLKSKQTFTPLGKIDLAGKAESKPESAAKLEPVVKPEPAKTVKAEAVVKFEPVKVEAVAKTETVAQTEPAVKAEAVKADSQAEAVKTEAVKAQEEEAVKEEAAKSATAPTSSAPAVGLTVVGKIDLSTLNQSTRPKKKTKEEHRREREAQQQANAEKKKRQRIGKERVDINDAANQAPAKRSGNPYAGGQGQNQNGRGQQNGKNNKKGKSNNRPQEVDDEAVAKQVKETLARLTNKQTQNKKGAKYRKDRRDALAEQRRVEMDAESMESRVLKITEFVTVSELATMMDVGVNQVIGTLMSIGIMASINQRLDAETINMVAEEFGFTTEYVSAEVQNAITEEADDEADLVPRAPIVTVMGHVDHGKTSLLDYIRKTNVIAGEAGGITQHIGAYNVELEDGRQITFLDTPGHEAFTAMRARGTQVTDIAIIIIAADDSVMPTTKEAIAHAQAAGVPMVFAINKIDKPGANPDKIREDLAQMNLLVEEWGGKYQCQEISAKQGLGVNELLEKVLLEAEMLDLKANPNRKATGSIIESSLDKGRGFVATVLVSNGTLKVGDIIVAGTNYGRVKALFNERNQRMTEALPSEPAIVLGLNGAPSAGDSFHTMSSEQEARDITN